MTTTFTGQEPWPEIQAAAREGTAILSCEQRTPAWYRARLGIPTTSEFKRFHTAARGDYAKGRTTYIAELIAQRFLGLAADPDDADSYWMAHGRALEDRARAALEMHLDADIEQVGIILCDGAGASPDGLIDGTIPHELKCPKASTHIGYLMAGGLPDKYKPQVHGHMALMSADRAVFQSYYPGLPDHIVTVERDDYTTQLGNNLRRFLSELEEAADKLGAPAIEGIPWTD